MSENGVLLAPLDPAAFIEQAERPVLVEFWATWCGTCRLVKPATASAARALAEHLDVVLVDVADHEQLARELGVTALPTFVLLDRGRELLRFTGGRSSASLTSELADVLGIEASQAD